MSDRDANENETEKVLRALADLADEDRNDSLPAPDDSRLSAYRAGSLSPEETRELEGVLAHSSAGRRRLLEISGIDRTLPLRRVRKAVLAQAGGRRRAPGRPATAALVALAAMIVLAVLVVFPRQGALPAGLAYDVSARGQAEVRAIEETRGEVRVWPATTLRIFLRPRGESPSGVWFALFRSEDGALKRVRQPEEVRLESDRGSASFSGTAARVLGTAAPGVHPLYVVVSAREKLPSRVDLEPGQDPAAALRASDRLIYPMKVILLEDKR